jgi:mRNA interferase MazF
VRTVLRGGVFEVWDVASVAFPYADRSIVRHRPALVIATPDVHARFAVLWVLMITSAQRAAWPGDVAITNLEEAGLHVPCFVRTEKIATVDARRAEGAGRLVPDDRAKVANFLRELLRPALLLQH